MSANDISTLPGLRSLWEISTGSPDICIAVIDGPADLSHPCFEGTNLQRVQTMVSEEVGLGQLSAHGTHITSVLFGQHGGKSPVKGIAPDCQGLVLPVFSDTQDGPPPQMDLARAVDQAQAEGAHIINISGGQQPEAAHADPILAKSIRQCEEQGILVVAAAGNDGRASLHVPAALPTVLAVGALDKQGRPLAFSNWEDGIQQAGIMAPGENILGAIPGAAVGLRTGTSFAVPIVTGVAALLLSVQLLNGQKPDIRIIRNILLQSAAPCDPNLAPDCRRSLGGALDIEAAYKMLTRAVDSSAYSSSIPLNSGFHPQSGYSSEGVVAAEAASSLWQQNKTANIPSDRQRIMDSSRLVYSLSTLAYDFGTEANRDGFKVLMPSPDPDQPVYPANPYDSRQMVAYLEENPSEARELIWTLNIELTPIYAVRPAGPYGDQIYERLIEFLKGQVGTPETVNDTEDVITRVSIPGRLTGETVRLYSGQTVPVIEPQLRGMYGWNKKKLIDMVEHNMCSMRRREPGAEPFNRENFRKNLEVFLNKIYYELQNTGQTSPDRALNYAGTNLFLSASIFAETIHGSYQLYRIETERTAFSRRDSDCWDVKLLFFNPANVLEAKKLYRFTIDVRNVFPVLVGGIRKWRVSR